MILQELLSSGQGNLRMITCEHEGKVANSRGILVT